MGSIALISSYYFQKFTWNVNIIGIHGLQRPPGVFFGSFLLALQKWLLVLLELPLLLCSLQVKEYLLATMGAMAMLTVGIVPVKKKTRDSLKA